MYVFRLKIFLISMLWGILPTKLRKGKNMNKLVYLFELDSVIKYDNPHNGGVLRTPGIDALFYEIIKLGNSVAITMNQLTDSQFISEALGDAFAYDCLLRLFKGGSLKLSLFGKYRTVSQYIQTSLDKCKENTFIFSNLPVKSEEKELISILKDALMFSDLTVIKQSIENAQGEEKIRLTKILRFINMILQLSVDETSNIPPKQGNKRGLNELLLRATSILRAKFKDNNEQPIVTGALDILDAKRSEIEAEISNGTRAGGDIGLRSVWLNVLPSTGEAGLLADKIIHLCYNYGIEDSINGVAKHYDDNDLESTFERDFLNRFELCLKQEEKRELKTVSKFKWKMLLRFVGYRVKKVKNATPCTIYEQNYKRERVKWIWLMLLKTSWSLLIALTFIGIFFAIEYANEGFESLFTSFLGNEVLSFAIIILILGLLGSFVGRLIQLVGVKLKILNPEHGSPDILESFFDIFIHLVDFFVVLFGGKNASYKLS